MSNSGIEPPIGDVQLLQYRVARLCYVQFRKSATYFGECMIYNHMLCQAILSLVEIWMPKIHLDIAAKAYRWYQKSTLKRKQK